MTIRWLVFLGFSYFALSCSHQSKKPQECSNPKIIEAAVASIKASAVPGQYDFPKAQKGLNILLSLQSPEAQMAIQSLKKTYLGSSISALRNYYLQNYDARPELDNSNDPIRYYSCQEIEVLGKKQNRSN